jgi:hypothetical protein
MPKIAANARTWFGPNSKGAVQPETCANPECGRDDRMSYTTRHKVKFWECDHCGQLHESEHSQGYAGQPRYVVLDGPQEPDHEAPSFTFSDLLWANEGVFSPEDISAVQALLVGSQLMFGGGAAAESYIRRVS